jgi:hypothetical protein
MKRIISRDVFRDNILRLNEQKDSTETAKIYLGWRMNRINGPFSVLSSW